MKPKNRLKSKTYWFAFTLTLLGPVEMNFHLMKDLLGDYYGVSFIVIAVAVAALREVTNGPVGKAKD